MSGSTLVPPDAAYLMTVRVSPGPLADGEATELNLEERTLTILESLLEGPPARLAAAMARALVALRKGKENAS